MGVTLGQRVREARTLRGMGANELDRAIGSKPGYISRVEDDYYASVGSEKLAKIAEVLRVSIDWLVLGRGSLEFTGDLEETARKIKERVGWRTALAEARERHKTIADATWEAVGELAGPGLPQRIDAPFLASIARALDDAAAAGLRRK
jgi:transcriptional regulator with XRE-family HTH domain